MLLAFVLLGIVIFIHELGHFLAAKAFGVKVEKFSIGYGPKLFGKKFRNTMYQVSLLPLGGYVKLLGETPHDIIRAEDIRFAYKNISPWKKAIIVSAGPFFNIALSFILFTYLFNTGMPVMIPEIGEVIKDSPAEKAGLMKGDILISIEGRSFSQWASYISIIHKSIGKELSLSVMRGNEILNFRVTPEQKTVKDAFNHNYTVGLIGINPSGKSTVESSPFLLAISKGFFKTQDICHQTANHIFLLLQRAVSLDTIGGPILIAQMAAYYYQKGTTNFILFAGVIGVNIGILNLLPIPLLDGGHLIFCAIEAIRKKPLSDNTILLSQKIGFALLFLTVLLVFFNDIFRLLLV